MKESTQRLAGVLFCIGTLLFGVRPAFSQAVANARVTGK